MESSSTPSCPHFQLHSELMAQEGPPAYLAIRHCLLTERMLKLLQPIPDAVPLGQRLVIQATKGALYAFVGPDLEAVTQQGCCISRCDSRCTPAYKDMLQQFDVIDPQEDTVTCREEDEANQKAANREPESSSCTCS